MWPWICSVCFLRILLPVGGTERQLQRLVIVGHSSVWNPYPREDAPLRQGIANLPLKAYTSRPWALPEFSVQPGDLTTRGRMLMEYLGGYLRQSFADLIPKLACEKVIIYADPTLPRAMKSAEALAQGLFAGRCDAAAAVNRGIHLGDDRDVYRLKRLFREAPDASDKARDCGAASREQELGVLSMAAGPNGDVVDGKSMAQWLRVYRRQLAIVQNRTGCCASEACAGGAGEACHLRDLPVVVDPSSSRLAIGGGLGVAAVFAEIFAAQWCEGLDAGWGLLEEEVVELLSLLEIPFHEAGANAETARNLGSELLQELIADLSAATGERGPPTVVAYMGRDSGLQFLRRLLKLNWLSEGWWPNVAEPGAQLLFELYSDDRDSGIRSVRVLKIAASPKQQRFASRLGVSSPPSVVPLLVPGCPSIFCPLPQFIAIASASLRSQCVEAQAAIWRGPPAASSQPADDTSKARTAGVSGAAGEGTEAVKTVPKVPAQDVATPQPEKKLALDRPADTTPPPSQTTPQPEEASNDGSWGGGSKFTFFVLCCLGLYGGRRYLQRSQPGARGYETLRSTGSPGFTL